MHILDSYKVETLVHYVWNGSQASGSFFFFWFLNWLWYNWSVTCNTEIPSIKRCCIKWPCCLCHNINNSSGLLTTKLFNAVKILSSLHVFAYFVFMFSLFFPFLIHGFKTSFAGQPILILRYSLRSILIVFFLLTWTAFTTGWKHNPCCASICFCDISIILSLGRLILLT